MNNLQRLDAERDYFVTLNLGDRIDPRRRDRAIAYDHPGDHATRASPRSAAGGRSAAAGATHYCGAYWRWGFHEDGCWSAHARLRAAARSRSVCAAPAATLELAA